VLLLWAVSLLSRLGLVWLEISNDDLGQVQKVSIGRQQGTPLLHRSRGYPEIVRGDRPATFTQVGVNYCIAFGSLGRSRDQLHSGTALKLSKLDAVLLAVPYLPDFYYLISEPLHT
jgi:hypothetical protein